MDDVKHLGGIVVSAQFHYLPEREGRGAAAQKRLSSRWLSSSLLLIVGFLLIMLWLSFFKDFYRTHRGSIFRLCHLSGEKESGFMKHT